MESNAGETADRVRAAFIDHITIRVRNLEASRRFYEAAVAPFGGRAIELENGEISFGPEGSEDLAIAPGEPSDPIHIAFAAPDLATVDRFYDAALAAGGSDNGGPALRPQYHPGYYAAYVLDPDGHNVEVVNHNRG
jgi:catechol 2,3-dioxygenase-like lactoylglutathione lyase family enzyme